MKTTRTLTTLLFAVVAFSTAASASTLTSQIGDRCVAMNGPTSRFNEALANGARDEAGSTWTPGARAIKATQGSHISRHDASIGV